MDAFGSLPTDSWSRAQLCDATARIYIASGYMIDVRPLAEPAAFLSTVAPGVTVSVGCLVKPGLQSLTLQEVESFWNAARNSGLRGAVMVTNGGYEAQALEFGRTAGMPLIDRAGLAEAINALPAIQRQHLIPDSAPGQLLTPSVPPNTIPPAPAPRPGTQRPFSPEVRWTPVRSSGTSWPLSAAVAGVFVASMSLVASTFFPGASDRMMHDLRDQFIHPVLNPMPTEEELLRMKEREAAARLGASGVPGPLMRRVIHRVCLLEELRQRREDERLAAELLEFTQNAKASGVDYVEMAMGDLGETIRLASEGAGLPQPLDAVGTPLQVPGLTPEEQARVRHFLRIDRRSLTIRHHHLDVDILLAAEIPESIYAQAGFDESLHDLARHLKMEAAVDERRWAQSLAAVVTAAQDAGFDLVAKYDGDLPSIVQGLIEGETVDDPESPFQGHTFKVHAPAPESLDAMMHFLHVRNGRLRYQERLHPELFAEERIDPAQGPAAIEEAVSQAEKLIRSTARDILVQSAMRNRSILPVGGARE